MGPTVTRPVQDPLAVLLIDNRIYISFHENVNTKTVSHCSTWGEIIPSQNDDDNSNGSISNHHHPASKANREVANLTWRKNPHTLVYFSSSVWEDKWLYYGKYISLHIATYSFVVTTLLDWNLATMPRLSKDKYIMQSACTLFTSRSLYISSNPRCSSFSFCRRDAYVVLLVSMKTDKTRSRAGGLKKGETARRGYMD